MHGNWDHQVPSERASSPLLPLSLSLSPSPPVSLPSVTLPSPLAVSSFLFLSLSLSIYIYIYLSLSLSISLPLHLNLSISLSLPLSFWLPFVLALILSPLILAHNGFGLPLHVSRWASLVSPAKPELRPLKPKSHPPGAYYIIDSKTPSHSFQSFVWGLPHRALMSISTDWITCRCIPHKGENTQRVSHSRAERETLDCRWSNAGVWKGRRLNLGKLESREAVSGGGRTSSCNTRNVMETHSFLSPNSISYMALTSHMHKHLLRIAHDLHASDICPAKPTCHAQEQGQRQ